MRPRKLHLTLALSGLTLLATGALAWGGDDESAPTRHGTFAVIQEGATFHSTDIDSAPAGPSPGDYFVYDNLLLGEHGQNHIGRSDGHCTVLSIVGGESRYNCVVIETLPGGTIMHEGIFIPFAQHDTFAIVGGTGVYRNARGTVHYEPRPTEPNGYLLFHVS